MGLKSELAGNIGEVQQIKIRPIMGLKFST